MPMFVNALYGVPDPEFSRPGRAILYMCENAWILAHPTHPDYKRIREETGPDAFRLCKYTPRLCMNAFLKFDEFNCDCWVFNTGTAKRAGGIKVKRYYGHWVEASWDPPTV